MIYDDNVKIARTIPKLYEDVLHTTTDVFLCSFGTKIDTYYCFYNVDYYRLR